MATIYTIPHTWAGDPKQVQVFATKLDAQRIGNGNLLVETADDIANSAADIAYILNCYNTISGKQLKYTSSKASISKSLFDAIVAAKSRPIPDNDVVRATFGPPSKQEKKPPVKDVIEEDIPEVLRRKPDEAVNPETEVKVAVVEIVEPAQATATEKLEPVAQTEPPPVVEAQPEPSKEQEMAETTTEAPTPKRRRGRPPKTAAPAPTPPRKMANARTPVNGSTSPKKPPKAAQAPVSETPKKPRGRPRKMVMPNELPELPELAKLSKSGRSFTWEDLQTATRIVEHFRRGPEPGTTVVIHREEGAPIESWRFEFV